MTTLYTNFDAVALRLVGKVRFTTDPKDENKMPKALAERLISEAEGALEHDLSPRYAMPFQTDAGDPFNKLPPRPTGELLRTMAELQSVMRILETDFGRGTAVDGDNYGKLLKKRYDQMLERLLERKDGYGWKYPPLPGLKLNYMNNQADDGFAGSIIVASGSRSQGYPKGQINDPSENFWTGFPPGWDHGEGCWRWEE